jgi:hypothetical protein
MNLRLSHRNRRSRPVARLSKVPQTLNFIKGWRRAALSAMRVPVDNISILGNAVDKLSGETETIPKEADSRMNQGGILACV